MVKPHGKERHSLDPPAFLSHAETAVSVPGAMWLRPLQRRECWQRIQMDRHHRHPRTRALHGVGVTCGGNMEALTKWGWLYWVVMNSILFTVRLIESLRFDLGTIARIVYFLGLIFPMAPNTFSDWSHWGWVLGFFFTFWNGTWSTRDFILWLWWASPIN